MEVSGTNQEILRWGRRVIGTAALCGSVSGLYDFAIEYGGWGAGWGVLFPATLDTYWITSSAILMTAKDHRTRVKAGIHTAIAISLSAAASILYREMHAGDLILGHALRQLLVAGGSVVPVLAMGALFHLTVLARSVLNGEASEESGTRTGGEQHVVPEPGPQSVPSENQNPSAAGSGSEIPATPEPEPAVVSEPEPGAASQSEPEPVRDPEPEPEPGESESQNPEPGSAPPRPAKPEPVVQKRGPARDPKDVARELKPEAEKIVETWLVVHGKRPTAAQLAKELGKSKAVACEALKLIQWPTPAPSGEVAV